MNITRERFYEIAEELKNTEVPYELFQIVHEALQDFNNGSGSFYNRMTANLNDEDKEKFFVMASLIVADQLPLYSRDQAIDSRIHDLNQLDNPESNNTELSCLDFSTLLDDEINDGQLLMVYQGRDVVYVPNYQPDLDYALQNHEGTHIGSEQRNELQPYITALLGEDDFQDLSFREQEQVASVFKEQSVSYDQEDIKAYYSNTDYFSDLSKYQQWDREKVFQSQKDFIHYRKEDNPPKFRDIFVHKDELATVVKYAEHKFINEAKKHFPTSLHAKNQSKGMCLS